MLLLFGYSGSLRDEHDDGPMRLPTKMKTAVAAGGCVLVGAVAGIAGAAASTSTKSTRPNSSNAPAQRWLHFRGRGFGLRGLGREGLGPAVHIQATVLDKAGTGFITVTEDNGTVQSLSGDQLTIKEAVGSVTYRTVTLTIPSTATVMRDFQSAKLSALHVGDRVRVAQSSDGTIVFAVDSSAWPKRPGMPGRGWGPGDPPGPANLPGPPPAGA